MNNAPLAAVFSFFIAISAMAQTTSDPKVQAALYDLGRAEQQLKSAQPGRVSALKRIAGMLENAELQLSASASPGEPGWSDAKNRLGQLKQRLQQLQNPQATQASASASSSGTNSPLSASDRSTLGDISRRTDSLAKDLARYSPKDLTTYEKLLMGKITDLKQRYQQLQNQAHPEAIGVAQKVIALETQIQSGANQNKQQASAAGELAPRLAAIGKRVQATRQGWATTPLPAEPYTTENTRDFAAKMMRLTEQLQQDAQFIEGIDQSLRNSISDGLANQIAGQQKRTERHKDELANNLERRLTQTDRLAGNASRLWGSDITKAIEKLETGVELIDVAEGYQTLLGRQHTASSDRRTRYTSAIKSLEAAAKAEAENPQPTTASTKPAKPNFDPQRIDLWHPSYRVNRRRRNLDRRRKRRRPDSRRRNLGGR